MNYGNEAVCKRQKGAKRVRVTWLMFFTIGHSKGFKEVILVLFDQGLDAKLPANGVTVRQGETTVSCLPRSPSRFGSSFQDLLLPSITQTPTAHTP
jgi:hypothetical protein